VIAGGANIGDVAAVIFDNALGTNAFHVINAAPSKLRSDFTSNLRQLARRNFLKKVKKVLTFARAFR
jgi:hypothetical protein